MYFFSLEMLSGVYAGIIVCFTFFLSKLPTNPPHPRAPARGPGAEVHDERGGAAGAGAGEDGGLWDRSESLGAEPVEGFGV